MKSGLKRTRTHSHTITHTHTHTHTWASTLACTHMSAYDKVSFKYLRCKWEWQMMSFPSSFSLSPLRPHLYLCLMWNLVKRNRCVSVRVCVALGVIRPFGSWHFSGETTQPSPARRASMSSCLQGVRPMLSFSLFSCVYFRFRTRFSNRLNTWQATATATKHTHTQLCVTLTYGTGWNRRPNAILTK